MLSFFTNLASTAYKGAAEGVKGATGLTRVSASLNLADGLVTQVIDAMPGIQSAINSANTLIAHANTAIPTVETAIDRANRLLQQVQPVVSDAQSAITTIKGITDKIKELLGTGLELDGAALQNRELDTLIEELQRKRSDLVNEKHEETDPDIEGEIEQVAAQIGRSLALKGVYQIVKSFLAPQINNKNKPEFALFETLINDTDDTELFITELLKKIDEYKGSNFVTKKFVKFLVIPTATGLLKKTTTDATSKAVDHLMDIVKEHSSSGSVKVDFLENLTHNVFKKITAGIVAEKQVERPLKDKRTKPQFLDETLNGDQKQKEQFYAGLTSDSITHLNFAYFNFLETLEKKSTSLEKLSKKHTTELVGKIFLTPLYATARTVMWIFIEIIARPIQYLLNKLSNLIVLKIAVNSNIAKSIFESAIEILTGENNDKGTEVLDNLLITILNKARIGLEEELGRDQEVAAQNPLELNEKEKGAMEGLLKAIITSVDTYSDSGNSSFEEMKKIALLGGESYNRIIKELSPLLVGLYRKITSKEALKEYIKIGLDNLNESLKSGSHRATDEASISKRKRESAERKDTINQSIIGLSPLLHNLLIQKVQSQETSAQKNKKLLDSLISELEKISQLESIMTDYREDNLDKKLEELDKIFDPIFITLKNNAIPISNNYPQLKQPIITLTKGLKKIHNGLIEQKNYAAAVSLKALSDLDKASLEKGLTDLKALSSKDNDRLGIACKDITTSLKTIDYKHVSLKKALEILGTISEIQKEEATNLTTEKGLKGAIAIFNDIKARFDILKNPKDFYIAGVLKAAQELPLCDDEKDEFTNQLKKLIKIGDKNNFNAEIENLKREYTLKETETNQKTTNHKASMNQKIDEIKTMVSDYENFKGLEDPTARFKTSLGIFLAGTTENIYNYFKTAPLPDDSPSLLSKFVKDGLKTEFARKAQQEVLSTYGQRVYKLTCSPELTSTFLYNIVPGLIFPKKDS